MTEDYNEGLRKEYDEIKRKIERGMLPLVARIPAIDKAVSAYVSGQDEHFEALRSKSGQTPIQYRDNDALDRFADLILYEELKWSHPDKMTIVEYPVMSGWQEELRDEKSVKLGDVEFGDLRYLSRRKSQFTDETGAPQVRNSKIMNDKGYFTDTSEGKLYLLELIEKAKLTEKQKNVVNLVFFNDLTQEDIADQLNISRQAVAKHVKFALKKMKGVGFGGGESLDKMIDHTNSRSTL